MGALQGEWHINLHISPTTCSFCFVVFAMIFNHCNHCYICSIKRIFYHKRARIPSSVVEAFASRSFPAKRGRIQNRTFISDPGKCPQHYCKHPWWVAGTGKELSEIHYQGRDFHPAHLGTSRHKLSVQGCLDISN